MTTFKLTIAFLFISIIANAKNMTFKYGGDWTNTTMIQSDNFMSMSGSFIGTNVMTIDNKEVRYNFTCTGLYQTAPAEILMGSCNMKEASSKEYWVLSWKCDVMDDGSNKCNGNAIGGTGKYADVTGKMSWAGAAGFGEGGGTFKMK